MALRAVPDHPKFADLKQRLGRSKGATLGYLECVWHFTGRFTPQGNLGKYSDSAIEAWVEWDGEPGSLIAALVESKWLDLDPVHRILVHDWSTHADKAAKQSLNRSKLEFCVPTVDTGRTHNYVLSALPVPVPVPVPESGAEPRKRAPLALVQPLPEDAEQRIRAIADDAPDQQDYEFGVGQAVQHLISSANPETTLQAMEANIPAWWQAMRDGRARIKSMRYVIVDRDYLRKPREPTKQPPRKSERDAVWDRV